MTKNLLELSKNKILGGKITLFQPNKGFRVSIDSILLSSTVKKYKNCMEFGTGSGVILIYLSKKFPNANILGIEKESELVELAKKNLLENNISSNIASVICTDLTNQLFLKEYNVATRYA